MKKLILATALFAVTSTSHAEDSCDVELKHGIIINPQHIRLLEKDRTQVQINNDNQLIVQGNVIDLDDTDQRLLAEYSTGLRQTVPRVVDIVVEAVDVALVSVVEIMSELHDDQVAQEKFKEAMKGIAMKMKSQFARNDDTFYLAPQGVNDIESYMDEELEEEIVQALSASIGSIFMAIGDVFNENNGDVETSINSLAERIETMSARIENEVGAKAEQLQIHADVFCTELSELDKIESQLQARVPELEDFDLIDVNPER